MGGDALRPLLKGSVGQKGIIIRFHVFNTTDGGAVCVLKFYVKSHNPLSLRPYNVVHTKAWWAFPDMFDCRYYCTCA